MKPKTCFLAAHRAYYFAICWWFPSSRFLCFSLLFLWNSSKTGNWNPQMDKHYHADFAQCPDLDIWGDLIMYEHEGLSAFMFPGLELDGLACKALVPQCYISCLESLAQAVTLRVSNFSALEPRGGRGWMIHLPIFTVENLEVRQAIKRSCVLVQFHIEFSIFSWMKIKIFYFDFEQKFQVSAETERKWKKKSAEKTRFYHRYLESNDLDLRAAFSFFASPCTLTCSLLNVKDVLKYVIITAFHCLMVSMHMNFSHSSFWEWHNYSLL